MGCTFLDMLATLLLALTGDALSSRGNEVGLDGCVDPPTIQPPSLRAQVRNARYIGELCKFRIFPHGAAFSMVGAAVQGSLLLGWVSIWRSKGGGSP